MPTYVLDVVQQTCSTLSQALLSELDDATLENQTTTQLNDATDGGQ